MTTARVAQSLADRALKVVRSSECSVGQSARGSLAAVAAAAVVLIGIVAAPAIAQPCTAANDACSHWVALKPTARSLVYSTFPLTAANQRITTALLVVHGGTRSASGAFRGGVAAAVLAQRLDETIVIAPRFASSQGTCSDRLEILEIDWECGEGSSGGWRTGEAAISHTDLSSFDLIDHLVRQLSDRKLFPNLRAITVAGFSAGGQFVNRYASANTVHSETAPRVTYVVASPSSYLYPDPLRPHGGSMEPYDVGNCPTYNRWSFGLQSRTAYAGRLTEDQLLRQLVSRPVTYLVGALENSQSIALDKSCPAMAQGDSRLSRAQAFTKHMAERYRVTQKLVIVPECGHDLRCVIAADIALPVLFPASQ